MSQTSSPKAVPVVGQHVMCMIPGRHAAILKHSSLGHLTVLTPQPFQMRVLTPTPPHVTATSPVQRLCTFAYTPPSACVIGSQHPDLVVECCVPLSDEDVLPTLYYPCKVVSSLPNLGRDRTRRESGSSEAEVTPSRAPAMPRKRKRSSGGEEPAVSLVSIPEGLSEPHEPSAQRPTRKTRRIGSTVPSGLSGSEDGHPGPSHVPMTPSRSKSRRVVLDAVEIVSKNRSRVADQRIVSAKHSANPESACNTASSYYPSPPASCAPKNVATNGRHPSPHTPHPNTVTHGARPSPEPTLTLKTSKYFSRASAGQTRSVVKNPLVPTPPNSPVPIIPVYVESSDFEYPPLDCSFDEPLEDIVDQSRDVPMEYNNPSLFGDLMIMLRRLKPILVQETVQDDPWKVLIAVRLLNVTTGKAAIPVFCKIISRWPTPQDLVHAPHGELVELLRPLGLYNKRAYWLKRVSEHFVEDQQTSDRLTRSSVILPSRKYITTDAPCLHYPGVGSYALDSLLIFCSRDKDAWKRVMPQDKELIRYLRWRWAAEEGKMWYPDRSGVIGDVDVPYLITLVDELAAHYDSAIGGEGYMYHFGNDLSGILGGDVT